MDSKAWQDMTPRERDAMVAECVLHVPVLAYAGGKHSHQGDHTWLDDPANYPHITDNGEHLSYWHEPGADGVVWSPSTDISVAWKLIDRHPHYVSLVRSNDTGWRPAPWGSMSWSCRFYAPEKFQALAETAPEAICLAALKAIGAIS